MNNNNNIYRGTLDHLYRSDETELLILFTFHSTDHGRQPRFDNSNHLWVVYYDFSSVSFVCTGVVPAGLVLLPVASPSVRLYETTAARPEPLPRADPTVRRSSARVPPLHARRPLEPEYAVSSHSRNAPVVIDTPIGRLDPEHKANLVDFYHEFSDQVIILYQPNELDEDDIEVMQEYISKHYQIKIRDDDSSTSTIEELPEILVGAVEEAA